MPHQRRPRSLDTLCRFLFLTLAALAGAACADERPKQAEAPAAEAPPPVNTATVQDHRGDAVPVYEIRPGTPDGIGKFYMGREIAQVMGHQGAEWLERPEREREEDPQKLMELMALRPADVVADIGAGTGYFSFRMAAKVTAGKVLAVDIQPEMLDLLKKAAAQRRVKNVEPVLGKVDDPNLPEAAVDAVLLVDAYHEFDHPREMMQAIVRALRPGGRVVLVEYRGEDPDVPIKPVHKMTEAQAKKEMAAVGLGHVKTFEDLPRQHVMIFQKAEKQ